MFKNTENASREFIFLGANIDAVATAERFGIDSDRASNYNTDSEGVSLNYEVISDAVTELRVSRSISEDWKEHIDSKKLLVFWQEVFLFQGGRS